MENRLWTPTKTYSRELNCTALEFANWIHVKSIVGVGLHVFGKSQFEFGPAKVLSIYWTTRNKRTRKSWLKSSDIAMVEKVK